MNLKTYATDASKKDGVKLEFDGALFTVASSDRPQWDRALERATKKHSAGARKADPALARTIMIEALANAVLITWEGVKDGEEDFPPTLENKIRILSETPEFRNWVVRQSDDLANFAAEVAADDVTAIKSPPHVG